MLVRQVADRDSESESRARHPRGRLRPQGGPAAAARRTRQRGADLDSGSILRLLIRVRVPRHSKNFMFRLRTQLGNTGMPVKAARTAAARAETQRNGSTAMGKTIVGSNRTRQTLSPCLDYKTNSICLVKIIHRLRITVTIFDNTDRDRPVAYHL